MKTSILMRVFCRNERLSHGVDLAQACPDREGKIELRCSSQHGSNAIAGSKV